MQFATDKLGAWSPENEFKVEAERTKAYAAATHDPIAAHTGGELAPPIFSVVPIWDAITLAMAEVTPPDALAFVVHGEQDIRWRRPVRPGDVLVSKAAPVGIHVKPSGTTVVVKVESRDQAGEVVVEQYMTSFFRGIAEGDSAGEAAPAHKLEDATKSVEPVATVTQQIDRDQTFRYADASGDRMPIHLDDDFAKQVGLPGIIIHGLCTMAFTSWAVLEGVGGGDTDRLRRLAVRFSKPVLPGEEITTRIWKVAEGDGATTYGFETTNPAGEVVIKDGLAEITG
jgi:acyl dehydratase